MAWPTVTIPITPTSANPTAEPGHNPPTAIAPARQKTAIASTSGEATPIGTLQVAHRPRLTT